MTTATRPARYTRTITHDGQQVPAVVSRTAAGWDARVIKLAGARRARTGHGGVGPARVNTRRTQ